MIPYGVLTAVIERYLVVKIVELTFLDYDVISRHNKPQMVVGVNSRYRLPSFVREAVVVTVTVLVLLCEEEIELILCSFCGEWNHGENILCSIANTYAAESTCRIVGNVT